MAKTLFTLIERPGCYPTAVTKAVLDDMHASGEVITASRPITKAEVSKSRIHVLDADHYFAMKAFAAFKTKFTGLIFDARVVWFNRLQGAGMAEGLNGEGLWPLYACNIPGKRTWFPETACVFHADGQVFRAEIMVSYGGSILVSHTPGTPDADKWDQLDHQHLAFRCDESGNATTGLFERAEA